MGILWGIVIVMLSALCWGGQAIVLFSPTTGTRLGLSEAEDDVEPTFWADIRGEALWDVLTLWTMVVAGALLVVGNPAWTYFGLIGGSTYLYFAGRGISTRVAMLRRDLRIGTPQGVKQSIIFLATWGGMGLITIAAATVALPTS